MSEVFNVLVVDDEPAVARLVQTLLERVGMKAVSVETGHQAMDEMRRREVDLVITDLQMAAYSGVELCEDIRRQFPEVPVIAMSGSGSVGENLELARAKKVGAAGVVAKPFRMEDFYREVARVLGLDDFAVGLRQAAV